MYWVRFFVRWSATQPGGMRHPRDTGAHNVEAFLSMMANERKVSGSTHNQALSAILFLYREVLDIDLPWLNNISRPQQTKRIPSVLTRDEVEPRFQYTYNGARGLEIVQTAAGAQITVRSTNQHRIEATLGLRMGLPWSSQLEIRVPYISARNNTLAAAVGFAESERSSGLGDAELQFTKQFATERAARPALLGALSWKPATGDFQLGQPSPGSGCASVQAGLTAVKRQDPLVFFGGISYTDMRARTYAGNRISPGNGFGFRVDTLLAASPETSLRAGLDLSHFGRTKINGQPSAGSQLLSGIVELGLSSLVSKNALINLNVGFGVTPDAPKLRLGVSLPIRFN